MKNILVFPNRGDPPTVPVGYEREPGNPYILRLSWIPCVHRDIHKPKCDHCKSTVPWCNFFDTIITPNECLNCTVDNKTSLPVVQ